MAIRNIVFDVGNVIVPWDPVGIERAAFGSERVEAHDYVSPLRGHPIFLALNRGELTIPETKPRYIEEGWSPEEVDQLFQALFTSFPIKSDTLAMMHALKDAGYRLFSITDNVHEIVALLKDVHDFWPLFDVAAVSAEIGVLKPDPRIYRWLLDTAGIEPGESVFMDDVERNVEGARAAGMEAFVFTDAAAARDSLRALGVVM
ncbi:HAD family hydrolase [Erythrobacter ani]|uniref:HAD family hydrolase n=1 Tax=Erythrobacter ani TaxID=2827235 RepID=UPI0034E2FD37